MDKHNKDTLANLISCELHRMRGLWHRCIQDGNVSGIEYWGKEIEDLEILDKEIWNHVN
jgi:hypothetical protein